MPGAICRIFFHLSAVQKNVGVCVFRVHTAHLPEESKPTENKSNSHFKENCVKGVAIWDTLFDPSSAGEIFHKAFAQIKEQAIRDFAEL